MKTLKIFIIATILSISAIAVAHQDHGQVKYIEISQSKAIMIAMEKVSEKVKSEKLDSSWDSVESKTAVLERMNGRQVWKVSLSQIDDKGTEVLNIYVSKIGEFISISK